MPRARPPRAKDRTTPVAGADSNGSASLLLAPLAGPADWAHLRQLYPRALGALCASKRRPGVQGQRLATLDAWVREGLRAELQQRRQGQRVPLPRDQVLRVVEWKLLHGTFRPALQGLVASNTDAALRAAQERALALLPEEGEGSEAAPPREQHLLAAVQALTVLRGVGPATASALLCPYTDALCFMSDEALACLPALAPPAKPRYTMQEYGQLLRALTAKACALNTDPAVDTSWTASHVEQALWTWAVLRKWEPDALPPAWSS